MPVWLTVILRGIYKFFMMLGGVYTKGRKDQKNESKKVINEEIKDAKKTRSDVEAGYRDTTPDERSGMRDDWFRD